MLDLVKAAASRRSPKKLTPDGGEPCGAKRLLGGLGFNFVVGQRETRLVAVAGVLVQDAFGDGGVDGGERRIEEIAGRGGVPGGDGGAQTLHGTANAGAVGAIHFGALTRLYRAL